MTPRGVRSILKKDFLILSTRLKDQSEWNWLVYLQCTQMFGKQTYFETYHKDTTT